jgi:hypothetical protein
MGARRVARWQGDTEHRPTRARWGKAARVRISATVALSAPGVNRTPDLQIQRAIDLGGETTVSEHEEETNRVFRKYLTIARYVGLYERRRRD